MRGRDILTVTVNIKEANAGLFEYCVTSHHDVNYRLLRNIQMTPLLLSILCKNDKPTKNKLKFNKINIVKFWLTNDYFLSNSLDRYKAVPT